jgi:hypothetical protein
LQVQNASEEKPTATQFSTVEKPVHVGQDLAVKEQERIISCHGERSLLGGGSLQALRF